MKKFPSHIFKAISILLVAAGGFGLHAFNHASDVAHASNLRSESYAYNEMVGLVSSISGNDITPANSGNQLVTYGFRHGDVSSGNIDKFDTFGDNLLGKMDSNTSAFFSNWRMGSAAGDGAIILFKANVKSYITIERAKIGADWKDGIELSIFKNNELLSNKTLSDANTTSSDFYFQTLLEEDDVLYWQIKYSYDGFRHISMDSGGKDWSTLPKFTIKEYVKLDNVSLTASDIVSGLNESAGQENLTGGLVGYKVYNGSKSSTLNDPVTINNNKVGNDNTYLSGDSVALMAKDTLSISFKAYSLLSLQITYPEDLYENVRFTSYQYLNSASGYKMMYDTNDVEDINGVFILNTNEELFIEYTSLSEENMTISAFDSVEIKEVASNDNIKSDYPLYNPTDYSSRNTFTHKEIAFETGRRNGGLINGNDFSIQLMTGYVDEENGEKLETYSTIIYDDGAYLNKSITPKVLLTGGLPQFDGEGFASIEDYRLKTTVAYGIVYRVIASKDTQLVVSHGATNGGWIDEAGKTYFAAYQSNGEVIKTVNYFDVISTTNEENAFSVTFNLKANDVAYYVFGAKLATQRNLNIAPVFTSNSEAYDEDARKDIFGAASISVKYYDVVTDIINNEYAPVIYKEALEVGLYHGDEENIQRFEAHKGSGNGEADDALITNAGTDGDAQFKRWQLHAGLLGDDALMMFTSKVDAKVSVIIPQVDIIYNEGASLRYYLVDNDGFVEFVEERYIVKDSVSNYYGFEAHLSENQAILIAYGANDESGYAVIGSSSTSDPFLYCNLVTSEFDETLVHDFSDAKELQQYKDERILDLEQYVAALNEDDYSVSSYGLIESYVDDFKKEVKLLTTADEVDELYAETINKINDVKTKAEEEEEIVEYRNAVKQEARAYMEARRANASASAWSNAETLYAEFSSEIDSMISKTDMDVRLIRFKTDIDLVLGTSDTPSSEPGSGSSSEGGNSDTPDNTNMDIGVIIAICAGGVVLVAALVVVITIIVKKKGK